MRDMLDGSEPYPLVAWSSQFDRIRVDLDTRAEAAGGSGDRPRTPEEATLSLTIGGPVLGRGRSHLCARRGRSGRRSARADPAVAAGATGGAQHRGRPTPGAEQRHRRTDRARGPGDLRRVSSSVSTCSWRRRWWRSRSPGLYLIRSNRRVFARGGGALRRTARPGAAADHRARIDAARNLARAARRVRAAADGDGIDADPCRPSACRRRRRCAPNCARSTRSRNPRSTTSAVAVAGAASRRSSTNSASRARSSRISPRSNASSG